MRVPSPNQWGGVTWPSVNRMAVLSTCFVATTVHGRCFPLAAVCRSAPACITWTTYNAVLAGSVAAEGG